jgi:DNA modification methylase
MAKVTNGKIDELKADKRNANLHSEHGTELLNKSLNTLGAGRSIVVSNENEIIAGNGVTEQAKAAGIEDIIFVETTGKELVVVRRTDIKSGSPEFYKMALADNIVAKENIVMDAEVMEALAEEIEGVAEWVAGITEAPGNEKRNNVTEDNFQNRNVVDPVSKLGDLYELNEHRVHCADTKKPETIRLLMNGRTANMVFTDVPYGNELGTGENDGYGRSELKRRRIEGDETTEAAIAGINEAFLHLENNSHFLCFIQWRTYSEIEQALKALGMRIKTVIVWDKKQPGLGSGVAEQHEFIILAIKGKAVQRFFTGNVWTVARPSERRAESEHPHKKPLELLSMGLDVCVETETLILEPFLGSGSLLVTCQQTGRTCYGQEIDPGNVDNIVLRWLKYMKENNLQITKLKRNGKTVLKEFEKLLNETDKN